MLTTLEIYTNFLIQNLQIIFFPKGFNFFKNSGLNLFEEDLNTSLRFGNLFPGNKESNSIVPLDIKLVKLSIGKKLSSKFDLLV